MKIKAPRTNRICRGRWSTIEFLCHRRTLHTLWWCFSGASSLLVPQVPFTACQQRWGSCCTNDVRWCKTLQVKYTINPCQEKRDFLLISLADLHRKATWNEIFSGSWQRLFPSVLHSTLGACQQNHVNTVRRPPAASPRTWEPYQSPAQPCLCCTTLPLFMCICSGENKLRISGRQNGLLDI